MPEAAHDILTRPARECTGNFFIDDDVLRDAGVEDLEQYRTVPGDAALDADLFIESETVAAA